MAWRTWQGFFVTDCNLSTEREGTQLCLLCVPSVVNYPHCSGTSSFKHHHCPSLHQGMILCMLRATGALPSAGTGLDQAQHTQKCQHCSPGSQRSPSPCQLNQPCLAWSWFGSCQSNLDPCGKGWPWAVDAGQDISPEAPSLCCPGAPMCSVQSSCSAELLSSVFNFNIKPKAFILQLLNRVFPRICTDVP